MRARLILFATIVVPVVYFLVSSSDLTRDDVPVALIKAEEQKMSEQKKATQAAKAVEVVPDAPTLPEETDPQLKEWNKPYHEWRRRVRKTPASKSIHTFYTIDCTYHSLWQVLTLEMTWERVEQGGVISRVISGCNNFPQKQPHLSKSIIKSDAFGAYFAPTFSRMPNGEYYAPYNRPNAIWYWLNHTDLTEEVLVLLDPDMAYMKPLPAGNVKKGHPVAQHYYYMEIYPLNKFECEKCAKPGFDVTPYAVGPPWLIHLDDLKSVMKTWVDLVPILKAKDPGAWIIEMVAYSVAMAFHNLPHELIYFGMVDNQKQTKIWTDEKKNFTELPSLLHYCYTWEIGEPAPQDGGEQMHRMIQREKTNKSPVVDYFHWSKYRVPTDWPGGRMSYSINFVSCDAPLFQEFHTRRAIPKIDENIVWYRTTIFLDILLPLINEAMTRWKVLNCPDGKYNVHKTLRTAHPAHWISDYEITAYHDELTVTAVLVEKGK